jgi:hypothetical protein
MGFMGDGLVCSLDPDFRPSTCDLEARFDKGTGRCICNPGFAGTGEATEETILAGISTCVKCSPFYAYKPGTRECTCKPGFIPGVYPDDWPVVALRGQVADGFVCVRVCPNGYIDDGSGFNCQDACPAGKIALYGSAIKSSAAPSSNAAPLSNAAPESPPPSAPEPSP